MSHDVYYQFHATPGQARRAGARGGQATARHRRERREGPPAEGPPEAGAPLQLPLETTAAAILRLDAHYPWLRGAETYKRRSNNRPRSAA